MTKPKQNNSKTDKCIECHNDHYIGIGCCSGFECGCMGMVTDFKACQTCNKDESIPPSDELIKTYPFFFAKNS